MSAIARSSNKSTYTRDRDSTAFTYKETQFFSAGNIKGRTTPYTRGLRHLRLNSSDLIKAPAVRMASFFQEMWESIFTPGPTPTLLLATNVTFAALQVVLATLLFATTSVHFVILSVLCGGLWAAINWFARELKQHQLQEEEKTRRAQAAAPPPVVSEDSDTEVEGTAAASAKRPRREKPAPAPAPASDPAPPSELVAVSQGVEPVEAQEGLKHRATLEELSQGMKSSVSTEDEWEKVSENETDKDK